MKNRLDLAHHEMEQARRWARNDARATEDDLELKVADQTSRPAYPYNMINASPTTTGETANGRSMIACSTSLPRNRCASTSAVGTPKITSSGTTIATTSTDNFSAEIATAF